MAVLAKREIERLFSPLNDELRAIDVKGELYLVGGAVMCLAFGARETTRDVDAYFEPSRTIREAAARAGLRAGVGEDWLSDAVKGYLSEAGPSRASSPRVTSWSSVPTRTTCWR